MNDYDKLAEAIEGTRALAYPMMDSREPVLRLPTDRELMLRIVANQMVIMKTLQLLTPET